MPGPVLCLACRYHGEMLAERGMDTEAQILEVIRDLRDSGWPLSVKDITSWLADRHGEEYERKITTRWVGSVIRKKLHLRTERTEHGYIVPHEEAPKLERLYERCGPTPGNPPSTESEWPEST